MRTIACVLKSGGWKNRHMHVEYLPADVLWLRDQLEGRVRVPYRFVCLSDLEIPGVDVIPLRDDLPGWWSKLELFRELEEALYIDLDTVITGDLTEILEHGHDFTVLRNFSTTDTRANRIGSGVMAWRGDYSRLYRAFMAAPARHMQECRTSAKWGDQGFIAAEQGQRAYFQDLFPGQVVSFKVSLRRGAPRPENRIVCFHGEPRPWQVRAAWIPDNVRRRDQ